MSEEPIQRTKAFSRRVQDPPKARRKGEEIVVTHFDKKVKVGETFFVHLFRRRGVIEDPVVYVEKMEVGGLVRAHKYSGEVHSEVDLNVSPGENEFPPIEIERGDRLELELVNRRDEKDRLLENVFVSLSLRADG